MVSASLAERGRLTLAVPRESDAVALSDAERDCAASLDTVSDEVTESDAERDLLDAVYEALSVDVTESATDRFCDLGLLMASEDVSESEMFLALVFC